MTDRPILFSGPMVRALLAGTKTQTRRAMKVKAGLTLGEVIAEGDHGEGMIHVSRSQLQEPRIAISDRLYVREAWRCNGWATDVATIMYRASEGGGYHAMTEQFPVEGKPYQRVTPGKWRPGIHMPRWASRLTLTVTDVRVERLQDISDQGPQNDCTAEGVFHCGMTVPSYDEWFGSGVRSSEKYMYRQLWEVINGAGSWDVNPWVAAYSFTVQHGNIDRITSPILGGRQ